MMRLVVITPIAEILNLDRVVHVRAEDETGAFGIRTGHADFLTALVPSVLSWRRDGGEGHAAVRGGVLTVAAGREVRVATRDAVVSDDLDRLEHEVLARFRSEEEAESGARTGAARLQLAAMRLVLGYLGLARPRPFDLGQRRGASAQEP